MVCQTCVFADEEVEQAPYREKLTIDSQMLDFSTFMLQNICNVLIDKQSDKNKIGCDYFANTS